MLVDGVWSGLVVWWDAACTHQLQWQLHTHNTLHAPAYFLLVPSFPLSRLVSLFCHPIRSFPPAGASPFAALCCAVCYFRFYSESFHDRLSFRRECPSFSALLLLLPPISNPPFVCLRLRLPRLSLERHHLQLQTHLKPNQETNRQDRTRQDIVTIGPSIEKERHSLIFIALLCFRLASTSTLPLVKRHSSTGASEELDSSHDTIKHP